MTLDHSSITLAAVGDLQLGDSATCVGFGFRSRVTDRDLAAALARFKALFAGADLAFANLETPLSDVGLDLRRRRSRQLRGAPTYAEVLRAGGFTVLNVANNHALEHGREAFQDSVGRVSTHGIAVCGLRGSEGWSAQPVRQAVNGLQVGMLGYSLRPAGDTTGDHGHAEANEAEIVADVARLRSEAECVIVSLHWGEEFAQVPSAAEVALAHTLVDAGAMVILGHHPHVARPVEQYRGALIAYSLGNFVGDMIWHDPLRHGLALRCELTAAGVNKVRVNRTLIDGTYLPLATETDQVPVSIAGSVPGLSEDEYIRIARSTVQAQRRALYRYTLRNAWRFEPRVLFELAASTLGGKVSRLSRGKRDDVWG